jgi:pimeloyl-ACP methyl ester carboxylesterase
MRALFLLVLLTLLQACAGVIDFMPKEIQDAEQTSIEEAKRLEAAHPDASRSYRVNGRTIHYVELRQEQAPRPLVIFVHGSPGLWRSWVRYLSDPDLQRQVDMVSMDRPGFGGSGSGRIERGLLKQSAALEPLLGPVQAKQQVILVGHAYGAALAARMAMAFPDKVTDLVLIAAPLDPKLQTESWFQYAADWPPITWLLPNEIVVFNREYLGLEQQLTEMLPLWPKITQRVTLLLGEQDEEVPVETADFAESVLIHARSVNVVRIPSMNHFIAWTRPDLVKAEILAHVKSAGR